MSAIIEALRERLTKEGDAIAVYADERELLLSELLRLVEEKARRIAADAPGKGPIAIDLANGLDWIVADLALLQLGWPSIALPPFFTAEQTENVLLDAGVVAVINAEGLHTLPPHQFRLLPEGTAKISYTSGSTGSPKGICLSEAQLLATAEAVVRHLGTEKAGRHLPLLPLGVLLENVAGLYASLLSGAIYLARSSHSIGLGNPFRPDFGAVAGAIRADQATSLILVPELLRGLTSHLETNGLRLPSLTLAAVGGARVPPLLIQRARSVGLPVAQGYGLTELGSVVTLQAPEDLGDNTVGRPLDHVTVTLANDGEIIVSGNTHLGMVGAPRGADPIATGDIGHFEADGRLVISGRKSNLIITAFGRNVSPEWVESELLAQPEIAQALVFGDGEAALSALIVPITAETRVGDAVTRTNAALPAYARIEHWELSRPFLPVDATLTANGRPRRDQIMARRAALPFFDRLVLQTAPARERLQAVPQLQAGLRGAISRETYVAYLTEAYHHVSHTVPLMRAARMGLAERPDLVEALDEYIAEETGHEQWILDDIEAAGGDPDKAIAQGPAPATAAMVDHAYATIREGNPVAFFGMVFVLEGTSIALAQQGAEAVRAALGLPKQAFRYLTSHGALDQDHMRFFETLVNGLHDPADQASILTMATEIFDLFAGIFAAIPMETTHELA